MMSGVHRLAGLPAARPVGGWDAPLLQRIGEVQDTVSGRAWSAVLGASLRCAGEGHAAFAVLASALSESRTSAAAQSADARAAMTMFAALADQSQGAAILEERAAALPPLAGEDLVDASLDALAARVGAALSDERRASLRERLLPSSVDSSAFRDGLQHLVNNESGPNPMTEAIETYVPGAVEHLGVHSSIAAVSRGVLGRLHAEFNAQQEAELLPSELDVLGRHPELFESVITRFDRNLTNALRSLFANLVGASASPAQALAVAFELEGQLGPFVQMMSRLDATTKNLRVQGSGTRSERLGLLGVRAGGLTRAALSAHAASLRVALELRVPGSDAEARTVIESASELGFYSAIPDGRNAELSELPGRPDGEFVEVVGVVQDLHVRRDSDGKLISTAVIVDPSSNTTAELAVVFVALRHVGVTAGATCRAHGIWKPSSNLADGRPAVEVSRLSKNSLRETSWLHALSLLSESFFPRWRNFAQMDWSWGPHTGELQSEAGDLGAAEVVFLPAFRSV
ncbi:MAG: hypothetical protein AAGA95_02360 [Pseudomonadota bacterium]